MSDLQLSLLAIGAVVVVGVYLFNWWQERALRRRLKEAFGSEHDDVLLRTKATPGTQRVEPQLQSAPVESPEPDAPAEEDEIVEPVVADPAPVLDLRDPVARPVPAVPWFDQDLDYIVELRAAEPIPEGVLAEFLSKAPVGGKPWHAAAYDAERGEWDELSELGPEPGCYTRASFAVQLVTRNGSIGAPQLAALCAAVRECGDKAGVEVRCPDTQLALNQAHDLDAFCADVDVAIGLNIVARTGTAFSGSKILGHAESAGFTLEPSGVFQFRNDAGHVLFTLDSHEPMRFITDQIKNLACTGLTLLLDVPRVPEPQQALTTMVQAAQSLATALGGRLVDDNRVPLSTTGIGKIKQQLDEISAKMAARGMPPGSERALRLFS